MPSRPIMNFLLTFELYFTDFVCVSSCKRNGVFEELRHRKRTDAARNYIGQLHRTNYIGQSYVSVSWNERKSV